MNRTLINSVLHGIELTSLDLLVLDCFSSHQGVFAQSVEINNRQGVQFNSDVVVGYYPILKDCKASITARLKKLVSKNVLWESNGVYGYDLKARDLYGALEHLVKEESLEDVEVEIKRKRDLFKVALRKVVADRKTDLLRATWPLDTKEGRTELNLFFEWWVEPLTNKGVKVRWEDEKAFDIFRRLLTWRKNIGKYGDSGGYSTGVKSNG